MGGRYRAVDQEKAIRKFGRLDSHFVANNEQPTGRYCGCASLLADEVCRKLLCRGGRPTTKQETDKNKQAEPHQTCRGNHSKTGHLLNLPDLEFVKKRPP
jgi:hypothetical protein